MASSNVYIEQYGGLDDTELGVLQFDFESNSEYAELQKDYVASFGFGMQHLYFAQNPQPRGRGVQCDKEEFSDSPENNPDLLDILRYAYGRSADGMSAYGSLDDDSGVLLSQRDFSQEHYINCTSSNVINYAAILQNSYTKLSEVSTIQNLVVSSNIDETQFDFLLEAIPVPYSSKNPVDSDVFIRVSNYAVDPLDKTTVVLRLNGVVQQDLVVEPFFAGYGGLDITWINNEEFDYGSRVDVEWEMYDTASPTNKLVIKYWFTTVFDYAGPRVTNVSPVDDAVDVSISSNIIFDIVDYETGVDISSLDLFINNVSVDSDSEFLVITEILDGYRVQYSPQIPFLYGDSIPVVVKVRDMATPFNETFYVWAFTTEGSLAPVLINMDPLPCATGVERIHNISFEVIDAGDGLDSSSITISIDNRRKDGAIIIPIIHRFD